MKKLKKRAEHMETPERALRVLPTGELTTEDATDLKRVLANSCSSKTAATIELQARIHSHIEFHDWYE
jgi:hypothetical protein